MTIRVNPTGTRGARVPKRGPVWKLFQLIGKRQVGTYRRGGEQRAWSEDRPDTDDADRGLS